jgi:hypothetical protein
MADPTGIGLGAGGGAIAGAVAFTLDRMFGSGRSVKTLDASFKELKDEVTKIGSSFDGTVEKIERLFDWHSVADPDDPAGKIWYFSVAQRKTLDSMQAGVSRLLVLLGELIQRFDRYNTTMDRLIVVVEKLQTDVNGLGLSVASLDRGSR